MSFRPNPDTSQEIVQFVHEVRPVFAVTLSTFLLGNVAEIQNFLRITKINLWSNLATRGRGVNLHTLVDRDAEALQERG